MPQTMYICLFLVRSSGKASVAYRYPPPPPLLGRNIARGLAAVKCPLGFERRHRSQLLGAMAMTGVAADQRCPVLKWVFLLTGCGAAGNPRVTTVHRFSHGTHHTGLLSRSYTYGVIAAPGQLLRPHSFVSFLSLTPHPPTPTRYMVLFT